MKKQKRKYDKKLEARLIKNEDEIRDLLKREWERIENEAKKEQVVRKVREGTQKAGKILLQVLFLGGICSVALIAPNVFVVYDKFTRRRAYVKRRDLELSIQGLQKRKDIEARKINQHEYEITITDEGKRKAAKIAFQEIGKNKEKKWDGWWRIVTFDIPETHKQERDGFREKLESMGFRQLQQSVLIAPYPCEKIITLAIEIFEVERYTVVLKTKEITGEQKLKEVFQL